MKHFVLPRTDAANLKAFFRARAIDRMRRKADRTASLQLGLERDNAQRNRPDHAQSTAPFWSTAVRRQRKAHAAARRLPLLVI